MPLPQIEKLLRRTHIFWDWVYSKLHIKNTKPITIDTYRGFGTEEYLYLAGRVLRKKHIAYQGGDGRWQNLIKNIRRFNRREINNAELEVQIGKHQFDLKTDY